MAETQVEVGTKIQLDGVTWDTVAVETGKTTKRADCHSDKYLENLVKRPLNRYMRGYPVVEEFRRGEMVTEEWTVVRLRAKDKAWNVYQRYEVKKGDL